MRFQFKSQNKKREIIKNPLYKTFGFSLTEFAIVLGIIGLVLGAIWGYASTSYENVHREQASEEISLIVSAVRSYYGSQNGVPELGVAAMMPTLIHEGVIPNNLTRTPTTKPPCYNTVLGGKYYCSDNPWGIKETASTVDPNGTLQVCDWSFGLTTPQTGCSPPQNPEATSANTTQFFAVSLKGLSNGSCIHMASYISSSLGPPGLVDVDINGTNIVTGLGDGLPVPTTDLNTQCSSAGTGPVNNVTFIYRITLQST